MNGRLVLVKNEACIVRDVFNLFVSNLYSYSDVARIVNDKYNKRFDSTSIRRILTNYKYKGYYCGRKSVVIDYKLGLRKSIDSKYWVVYRDKNIPAIVLENVWDRVNSIIEKRSKKRFKSNYNIFCGLHNLRCKYVSKRYGDKYYHYYVCNGCFSLNGAIIDNIVLDNSCKKVVVIRLDDVLKIDLYK